MDGIERELGAMGAELVALGSAFQDFRDETRKQMDRSTAEVKAMIAERLNDHSKRIRALELWRAGLAAACVAVPPIGAFLAWLFGLFGGHTK